MSGWESCASRLVGNTDTHSMVSLVLAAKDNMWSTKAVFAANTGADAKKKRFKGNPFV